MAIGVALCDNHPLYLQALRELVEQTPFLELAGVATTGSACLTLLRERHPSACVLDITVGEVDGVEVVAAGTREGIPSRFLILSDCADPNIVYKALAAGAAGYLLKTAPSEEIVASIKRIAEGGNILSNDLGHGLVSQINEQHRGRETELTEREREVLRHLCDGGSAAEIGRQLFLGSATVRTHLSRIYEKLGVSGRAGAVATALRTGLVE
jgi:two-component system, NarL family, nitrate/nitrite response regulator NarL